MGKAHMGVGVAAALALLQPTTTAGCVAVLMGASLGSVICDVDVQPGEKARDAHRWRMIALVGACALLAYDFLHSGQVCSYLMGHLGTEMATGVVGMVAVTAFASFMPHRTFAHSLLALVLWCASLRLLCEPLVAPFAAGVGSHLLLDLTNKKGIRLFWPLKTEFSLGLWRADGRMNDLLALVGMVASIALMVLLATGRHPL